MKSKILLGIVILSLTSACSNNGAASKYQLRDTWGANGDWGGNGSKSVRMAEDVEKETPKTVKKETPKKSEPVKVAEAPKKESPKQDTKPMKESPKKMEVKEDEKEVETVSQEKSSDNIIKWEKRPSSGAINAYYVKEIPDENLNFSYGMINNAIVDKSFKDSYKKKLSGTLEGFKLVSDKDVAVQGKKAWEINYVFDKEGEKIQQKQVFIQNSKNLMVANFTATEKGFNKVAEEFDAITENLKL